jgi:hypothetical protein
MSENGAIGIGHGQAGHEGHDADQQGCDVLPECGDHEMSPFECGQGVSPVKLILGSCGDNQKTINFSG